MANQPPPPTAGRSSLFRLLSQVQNNAPLQPTQPTSLPERPPPQQLPLVRPPTQPQTSPTQPPTTQSQTSPPGPPVTRPPPPQSQTPPMLPQATTQPEPSPMTQDTPQPISSVGMVKPAALPPPRTITAPSTPTPPLSPRTIKPLTPPPSPKTRQLPPGQLMANPEPEPKPLLLPSPKSITVQEEATNKGNNSRHLPPTKREDKNAAMDGGYAKGVPSKKDADVCIITMAGENMGAYMELGRQGEHSPKGHEGKPDTEAQSGGKATKAATKTKSTASRVNSNVQSVNNSILFNTSYTARSPGVHISFTTHGVKPPTL